MRVILKIKRFDPEKDSKPYFAEYDVEVEPTDRVLDALNHVKWYQDGTLTYRRSCAHGICGSDAMRINGRNRLACKVLIKDVGEHDHHRAAAGLHGDQGPGRRHGAVLRAVPLGQALPGQRRRRRPRASGCRAPRSASASTTRPSASCAPPARASCPPFWANREYVGPAAIVNAHRFIFDSRDQGGAERLEILNERDGVWRCRTIFNCTEACPRDIKVTKAIEEVKRAIMFNKI